MSNQDTKDVTSAHQYTAVLDLRLYDPHERLPLLEMTMAALAPGEDVLLMMGSEPARLLGHLDRDYGDRFTWELLQEGPELWRLWLRRTAPDRLMT